jgi:hypothetical protein
LQQIEIPNTVEILGKSCFAHCKALSDVVFTSGSQLKQIKTGCLASLEVIRTYPEGVPECAEKLTSEMLMMQIGRRLRTLQLLFSRSIKTARLPFLS